MAAINGKMKSRTLRESNIEGSWNAFGQSMGIDLLLQLELANFSSFFDDMGATPMAANNLRKRMKQLMNFAVLMEYREDNPVMATSPLKTPDGGFPDWSEDEIAQFEARHPVGTRARTAFDLALFTSQRKADVRVMGPSDIACDKIKLKQRKTGKELLIPIHPNLALSLASINSDSEAFILNDWGDHILSIASACGSSGAAYKLVLQTARCTACEKPLRAALQK
jgi:integrase